MAYATVTDIADRLGRTLSAEEETKVTALIKDVSALVSSYCRKTFVDPVPDDVTASVCNEVIRILNTNPGISSETVGDVRYEYSTNTGNLSRQTLLILAKYRVTYVSTKLSGGTWEGLPESAT